MQLAKLAAACCLLLLANQARAQANDSAQVRETALNYVEGFFNADPGRVNQAISPELVKRIVFRDSAGHTMIQNMGSSDLLFATQRFKNNNALNPGQPFSAQVLIYDISGNVATVKVLTNKFRFIDYLHLARIRGEWKIINVLWDFKP
jgi:hypothetical protein